MSGKIGVYYLVGPEEYNDIPSIKKAGDQFLKELGEAFGAPVECVDAQTLKEQGLSIFFVASGGAEPSFVEALQKHGFKEPYYLITQPVYNSLPAAFEMMGYLGEHDLKGEILHGKPELICKRLSVLARVAETKKELNGMHIAAFGDPDLLIASNINQKYLKEHYGISFTRFGLEELLEEYGKGGYEENQYTLELKAKGYDKEELEKTLNLYGAMKRLIKKYDLQAITIRCFEILERVKTTACIALAILNSEGIPAACESDEKSLLSMVLAEKLTGNGVFMANPCQMDPEAGTMMFAHCTLPLTMCDDYYLTTHFESGIGVAVSADIEAGTEMTVFKCDGEIRSHYAGKGELLNTSHEDGLCRTQMVLKMADGGEYFRKRPISNHHIVCRGDCTEVLDEFFK